LTEALDASSASVDDVAGVWHVVQALLTHWNINKNTSSQNNCSYAPSVEEEGIYLAQT